jgi:hypothetical protein
MTEYRSRKFSVFLTITTDSFPFDNQAEIVLKEVPPSVHSAQTAVSQISVNPGYRA